MFGSSKKDDTVVVEEEKNVEEATTDETQASNDATDVASQDQNTENSDDLLIISDDTSEDDTTDTIEFSFDEESSDTTNTVADESTSDSGVKIDLSDVTTEEASQESPLVDTMKDTEDTVVAKEDTSDTATQTPAEWNIDLSFDLSPDATAEAEQDSSIASEESPKTEETFSIDLDTPTVEETPELGEEKTVSEDTAEISFMEAESSTSANDTSSWDDTSMNEILSGTIAKLESRKETIAKNKEDKKAHEAEIKDQIKALEDEHAAIEAELTTLANEDKKITANIAELEKMKLDPVKEHNEKRVKK